MTALPAPFNLRLQNQRPLVGEARVQVTNLTPLRRVCRGELHALDLQLRDAVYFRFQPSDLNDPTDSRAREVEETVEGVGEDAGEEHGEGDDEGGGQLAAYLGGASVLVVHTQAQGSRTKRLALIERLSDGLYARLDVVGKFAWRELREYEPPAEAVPLLDVDVDERRYEAAPCAGVDPDWWRGCKIDGGADEIGDESAIDIDFGDAELAYSSVPVGADELDAGQDTAPTCQDIGGILPRRSALPARQSIPRLAPRTATKAEAVQADASLPRQSEHMTRRRAVATPPPDTMLDNDILLRPHANCRSLASVAADTTSLYLTTLYESRAPLIFLAKSGLPKLRASLAAADQAALSAHILTGVLPSVELFDNKYKSFVPTFVKAEMTGLPIEHDLSLLAHGRAEAGDLGGTTEPDLLRAWLEACADDMTAPTPDALLAKHLQLLKVREAQMMVLFLLEAMCHPASSSTATFEPLLESVPATLSADVVLDLMLDRLSIWQALDFSADDKLRSFCLEAVAPYYGARIPDVVRTVQVKCRAIELPASTLEPRTPRRPGAGAGRKDKKKDKDRDKDRSKASTSRTDRNAQGGTSTSTIRIGSTLKRTESAPASLLSAKKAVPAKRGIEALKRQVSMSRRLPPESLRTTRPTAPRSASDAAAIAAAAAAAQEEKRRRKMEQLDRDRVQVGHTPAKDKLHGRGIPTTEAGQDAANLGNAHQHAISQFSLAHNSKASFMFASAADQRPQHAPAVPAYRPGIAETPHKSISASGTAPSNSILETPAATLVTPARQRTRPTLGGDGRHDEQHADTAFAAPGIEDTPSRSVLFHLASPTLAPRRLLDEFDGASPSLGMPALRHRASLTHATGSGTGTGAGKHIGGGSGSGSHSGEMQRPPQLRKSLTMPSLDSARLRNPFAALLAPDSPERPSKRARIAPSFSPDLETEPATQPSRKESSNEGLVLSVTPQRPTPQKHTRNTCDASAEGDVDAAEQEQDANADDDDLRGALDWL